MSQRVKQADVLIVGAGFAGAATAFHLLRSSPAGVIMLDKEQVAGYHASGRNASLLFQPCEDLEIRRLLAASRRAYETVARQVGFEQQGSVLLGSRRLLERVHDAGLLENAFIDAGEIRSRIPLLEGHAFESALETPSDGVMDIARLLQFYLNEAGARGLELWLDCEVTGLRVGSRVVAETTCGTIEAGCLVNAAGAWAGRISAMAGAMELPLMPLKRHLFVLDGIAPIDSDWPFVWSLDGNFYFRPESGGLLFSLCDEERSSSLEPTVSSGISESLAELVWQELPALREATQRKVWSCFRTRTPDGSFVIGRDPALENFFWVAGLGGHGMGASWAVGQLAAELLEGSPRRNPFDPGRF